LPAAAIDYGTWGSVATALDWGSIITINVTDNITASGGAGTLTNWGLDTMIWLNGYTISGGGGTDPVINNIDDGVISITSGGNVINTGTGYSIVNDGWNSVCNLSDVTLSSGLCQTKSSSKFNAGYVGNYQGVSIALAGPNYITAGEFGIEGERSTISFSGGLIDTGVFVSIAGPMNAMHISGGDVNLNGSGASSSIDLWESGSAISLSAAGNLILNDFQHDAADGAYNQSGGTLNLTHNSSILDLNPITTNGSGSGSTTVNIGTTASADTSSLTMETGCHVVTAAAGDTLTVNVGSQTSTGNSLNISGGTLDATAAVMLQSGNSLNLSAGTATLNGSGTGVDVWIGTVNLSGGTLTVNAVTSNGILNQTGGNLTLEGSSIVNLDGNSTLGGPLLVVGNSILTHEGSSTLAGKVTVNGDGIIGIKNGTELGAPAVFVADQVTLNGGTLMNMTNAISATGFASGWSPTLGSNVGIALGSSGGIFQVGYVNQTLTINGVISGTGSLTKTDISTLVLGGVNTYTGPTTVTAGTLSVINPNFCPTASLNIASGAVLNIPNSGVCMVSALILGGVTQPEGLYQASNTGGTITGQGVIQVGEAVVTSAYLTWAARFPGLTDAYPTHDPDGDGLTNHQEYAFGLDPSGRSSENPIRVPLDQATGTFSYSRLDPATTGLSFTVQTSSDLSTWSVNPATQTVTQTVSGVQTVQVTLSDPKPLTASQLFVRVAAQ
jgi:autotransporter-associated beta strand protein